MGRTVVVLVTVVALVGPGWAANYVVTNTHNTGPGSLRQAIKDANAHLGPDWIIFDASLAGKSIAPKNPLPPIVDARTTIKGDINNDGRPDILLDGSNLGSGAGLVVKRATQCAIVGLAIANCPDVGLRLQAADQAEVRACYFGMGLGVGGSMGSGEAAGAAGEQVELLGTDNARLGGSGAKERNWFFCGSSATGTVGLRLVGSQDNYVAGCRFGLTQDGAGVWTGQNCGVRLEPSPSGRKSTSNSIGAEIDTGEANYFAACQYGVYLDHSTNNYIRGSYYGLALNGTLPYPIENACVYIGAQCNNNRVGGYPSERNVFVSQNRGVTIQGPNVSGTQVQGNYFGMNGTATERRVMGVCVGIVQAPGLHTIGGLNLNYRNYLVPNDTAQPTGVELWYSGAGAEIVNNSFGELPGSSATMPLALEGIYCVQSSPLIRSNRIVRASRGLEVIGGASNAQAYGNEFVSCPTAIRLDTDTRCRLGNVSNASSDDDSGNSFVDIANWFIYSLTVNNVTAEDGSFGTTSKAAINAKIHDRRDDPSLGRVDFDPLFGGVHPSGAAGRVAVSGAAAVPTAGGAEVAFTLSSPAEVTVTVLNVAGRPVATVLRDCRAEAGLQRVVWNGQSATGTRAPAGTYLVRITARGKDGSQTSGLTRLPLRH